MTEEEWLAGEDLDDLRDMTDHGGQYTCGRKQLLFACACCRRVWHLIQDDACQEAVRMMERCCDDLQTTTDWRGTLGGVQWQVARDSVNAAMTRVENALALERRKHLALGAVWWALKFFVDHGFSSACRAVTAVGLEAILNAKDRSVWQAVREAAERSEARRQCQLLREIMGNPFRSVVLGQSWLTWNDATVPKLAQTIYDEGDFSLLPILADALEEAGCDNGDILRHCREPGEHIRGCWVVDLILGKE